MDNSQRLTPPGKRSTIAFLTAQMTDSNGMELWRGVTQAARDNEANLICFVGDELQIPIGFRAQANVLYEFISPEQVDGLVIWGSTFSNYMDMAAVAQFCERHRTLPIVTIATPLPGIPCVLLDNYQAMYDAMVHLITVHQHTRIACIRGPKGSPEANERYRAYIDVLRDYGIPFDPELVEEADYWNKPFGRTAIDAFFTRLKMPLQAVVAACDAIAIDAIDALQLRELRVPGDVAVMSFDDAIEGRYASPPLTSVPIPYYAQGRRAVELLLDVFAGKPAPERVMLAPNLIVRQSCGCVHPTVKRAAVGRITPTGTPLHTAAARQEQFLCDLVQQMINFPTTSVRVWGTRLLDTFIAEMQGAATGTFLAAFDGVLCQVYANNGNLGDWQEAITILRRHTLPFLGTVDELAKADDLWQQAQVMLGQMMQRTQAHQAVLAEQAAQELRELEAALITSFDLDSLLRVVAEGLPRLGIPGCALALYDDPQRPTGGARCLLAYAEQRELEIPQEERHFPSQQLVPRGFLPQVRPYHLVVESLYFQESQIGFIVFEPGPRDGKIYEILRSQISSALQGALLVQRVQQHSAELARKQYIIETFMANIPDAIYFKDRDCRLIQVNQAYANLFGASDPANLVGKTDFDFFPEEQARSKFEVEQEILRTGQPLVNLEEPDADNRWSLTTKMPLRDENGAIIGTFGISRDITALKHTQAALEHAYADVERRVKERTAELQQEIAHRIHAEEKIRILNAELERRVQERTAVLEAVNRELQDFAYVVSHDLKAPLRGIAHLAQWLVEDYRGQFDEDGQKMIALMVGRANRMENLIEGILQYSRIGHANMSEGVVDLRLLVLAVIETLAVPEHIRITTIGEFPVVRYNMTRMTQIFQNLIGNAIKFIDKPEGIITISCQNHGDSWLFRVTDNGPGIEARHYERIFKIFQTLTARDQFESTGIGLAVVKKIVELYGGKIWVESIVGEGSTFLFTLPRTS
ncbi:multi-sensor signal transduction histidine kinase [Candidatus Moduliflexus flocculans]|uniref:histidine kinase n=1 Tax=Candidatus Moduliflexus flocculans TaxID=1499966 RepID=A0A081BRI6_9BACT|nr:multi-sensor signal transduction histidine kinase [Candidatus Moduliflexus flocculans]